MRLLILGTGGMAAQHAKHFAAIKGVTLVGGVDVDPKRLEAFNTAHKIKRGFASLDAALAWGGFDAIANVTPDSVHYPTSLAAIAAVTITAANAHSARAGARAGAVATLAITE